MALRISTSNHTVDVMSTSTSNIDVVDDIEVVLAPNFDSHIPHEVLGCSSEADIEELDRAYRDLSRKYHPENTQQDGTGGGGGENDTSTQSSLNPVIFQKITQAYAQATGKVDVPRTEEDARQTYESMFGKYSELYYNEAGLIGIPYSSDLNEILKETSHTRNILSLTLWRSGDWKIRVLFLRTRLIKKEMNVWLWMSEIFLTWVVVALCVLAFLLNKNPDLWPIMSQNDGQILDIAGGVALMFAQFILCFWYGFSRYPAGANEFIQWLYPSGYSDKQRLIRNEQDMEDIRCVCSQYLHDDKEDRFNPTIVWICFPVVLVEQAVASVCLSTARALFCCCRDDRETQIYGQHLSRSIAGLIVVMGHYLLWMYGNAYCKLAGTACLLVSQNLYDAVLFKKNVSEFLQSFIFGNVFLLASQKKEISSKIRCVTAEKSGEAGPTPGVVHRESGSSSGSKIDLDVTAEHLSEDDENDANDRRLNAALPSHGTPRVATMPTRSDTAIFVKEHSFCSPPPKSRSLTSFNPLAMLKSATFPKREKTDSTTPDTLQEEDNVSLDLSYIDHGEIETFVGTVEESRDRSGSLNAAEILEDLAEEESEIYGERSYNEDLSDEPESNHMLSIYKATKRRLEEAFYSSTRIHVEDGVGSSSSSNDSIDDRMPTRLQSQESYDFTLTREESELQKNGGDYLPPILRVFDDVNDEDDTTNLDVELGNDGMVLGDQSINEPSPDETHAKRSNSGWKIRNRSFFGRSEEKKDERDKKESPPPMEQIVTDNRTATFDEDLTRTGTWDESIIDHPDVSERKCRPKLIEDDFDEYENDICCAEEFLP